MKFKICNPILILHNKYYSPERTKNVGELMNISDGGLVEIIKSKFDFTEEEILYWTCSCNFQAMPVIMYSPRIIGRVGCLISHMWALERIVEQKLNNTIIFEDDAYKVPQHWSETKLYDILEEKNFSDDYIVYLGYSKNPKNGKIFCCHAYMIPDWKKAAYILNTIKNKSPKRAIDAMLINIVQMAGLPFSYYNIFGQLPGYSYIDMKEKTRPGKWN